MIYVTGDMHGDYRVFKQPVFKNIKKNDTLIICGDFGFIWNGGKGEKATLDKLSLKSPTPSALLTELMRILSCCQNTPLLNTAAARLTK